MSGHRHHQRSASTGSQRIMHDIGLTSSHLIHQMSSSSPEPFSEEDEDGENEDLDMKGTTTFYLFSKMIFSKLTSITILVRNPE